MLNAFRTGQSWKLIRKPLRHAYLTAANYLSPWPRGEFLRFIYCHGVPDNLEHRFAAVIHKLTERGTFIGIEDAVGIVSGKRDLKGQFYHLSFDDCARNIVTNAVPVLKYFGISALWFVPTGLVRDIENSSPDGANRRYGNSTTATWEDLALAQRSGMEIGSHTHSHARLSSLTSPADLKKEIVESKALVEVRLGTECRYISWPYGTDADISPLALERIRHAGYKACFSGVRRAIICGRTDPMQIPRQEFEVSWPASHIDFFCKGGLET